MIPSYISMLADQTRIRAFQRAIAATVRPSHVVVEVGAGVGTFALLAAQAGARVHAIEESAILDVATQVARLNGLSHRIRFYRGHSRDIELPERADVLIIEAFWSFMVEHAAEQTLRDARSRFLKPGGLVLPAAADLRLVPVQSHQAYQRARLASARQRLNYGIDFEPLWELGCNNLHNLSSERETRLATPKTIQRIDLQRHDSFSVSAQLTYRVRVDGTMHGLSGWFDLQLCPGVRLSNGSRSGSTAWGRVFFPFSVPLRMQRGDHLDVAIETVPWGNHYYWNWQATLRPRQGKSRSRSQSTFRGFPLNKSTFQLTTGDAQPRRNRLGDVELFVLQRLDGKHSITQIARTARRRFPDCFRDVAEAQREVASLVEGLAQPGPPATVSA